MRSFASSPNRRCPRPLRTPGRVRARADHPATLKRSRNGAGDVTGALCHPGTTHIVRTSGFQSLDATLDVVGGIQRVGIQTDDNLTPCPPNNLVQSRGNNPAGIINQPQCGMFSAESGDDGPVPSSEYRWRQSPRTHLLAPAGERPIRYNPRYGGLFKQGMIIDMRGAVIAGLFLGRSMIIILKTRFFTPEEEFDSPTPQQHLHHGSQDG